MNFKQFVWVSAMTVTFYCFLWANANPQYFGLKSKGIHPIGSQAVYIAGEACIINLEKDSDKKFCAFPTYMDTPSYQLISTLNECLNENNMTVETAPQWVVPSHQECLRLHDQWRKKKK